MKKRFSLLMAVWMILTCLVSPAFAADSPSYSDAVTFTNAKSGTAGLTAGLVVSKEVVCERDDTEIPEEEFLFALNVNGFEGQNQPYELYRGGQRIVRYFDWSDQSEHVDCFKDYQKKIDEGHSVEEMSFTTNLSGQFTLQDGDVVVFTGLDEGTSYQVMEVDMPLNFKQVVPADAGGYSGTASSGNTELPFTNRYTPPDDGVPPLGTCSIKIRKDAASLTGYDLPESDVRFRFKVKVAGEPWSGRDYLVLDTDTGAYVTSGITDEEGGLFLGLGQTALVENVPEYSNYTVEEDLQYLDTLAEANPLERWRPVGSSSKTGNIGAEDVLLEFRNSNASFGVKKTLDTEAATDPELRFNFELTRQEDDLSYTAWDNVPFYLFDDTGKLVTNEDGSPAVGRTSNFGEFSLGTGQTAVFLGATPGQVYGVKEYDTPGYIQKVPADPNGYKDQKVTGDNLNILSFVNSEAESESVLSVSKMVKTESAGFDPNTEFTFQLKQKKGNDLVTMNGAFYMLNENSLKTAPDGTFVLKDGETAYFNMLLPGEYVVEELGVKNDTVYSLDDYLTKPDAVQTGMLTDEGLELTFVNYYKSSAELKILKVDEQYQLDAPQEDLKLAGAVFELRKLRSDNTEDSNFQVVTLTTDENGEITIPVVSGRYSLTEVQAPQGYLAPEDPFVFEISVKKGTIEVIPNTENPKLNNWIAAGNTEVELELIIKNGFYVLPKTGGLGTHTYTLSGLALMSMSLLWIIKRKIYD